MLRMMKVQWDSWKSHRHVAFRWYWRKMFALTMFFLPNVVGFLPQWNVSFSFLLMLSKFDVVLVWTNSRISVQTVFGKSSISHTGVMRLGGCKNKWSRFNLRHSNQWFSWMNITCHQMGNWRLTPTNVTAYGNWVWKRSYLFVALLWLLPKRVCSKQR